MKQSCLRLLILLAILLLAKPAPAQPLRVFPLAAGNLFNVGDPIRFAVVANSTQVNWRAVDFDGTEVASGNAAVVQSRAQIITEIAQPGFYEFYLTASTPAGVALAGSTTAAVLSPLPTVGTNSRFGVMTHFAQGWNLDLLPIISKMGVRHIRDEQYWADVETIPGTFSFPPLHTDYMAATQAAGLEPLIEFTFGNALYDNDGQTPPQPVTPYSTSGLAAFARYGKAVLNQYGAQIKTVEVWNEFNGTWGTGPAAADRPLYHARMLAAVYPEVKNVRPDVTVLGGAAVLIPLGYFRGLFGHGGLANLDALVIHPYRANPEGVEKELRALREIMTEFGGPKPVWATEFGSGEYPDLGKRQMAAYLVQMQTLLLSEGVARSYWYLQRDYQNFVTGLVYGPDDPKGRYVPTAAFLAYRTSIALFDGYEFVRRENSDPRDRFYRFAKSGQPDLLVCWSTDGAGSIRLPGTAPLQKIDVIGRSNTVPPVKAMVEIPLGRTPFYLLTSTSEAGSGPRAERLLADSRLDYLYQKNSAQGAASWRFGWVKWPADTVYPAEDFTELTWMLKDFGYEWTGPHSFLSITESQAHPSSVGFDPIATVRRWTSTHRGAATIRAAANRPATGGDCVDFHIFIDGKQIYHKRLSPTDQSAAVTLPVTLSTASKVDFVITCGPCGEINFDATEFSASITTSQP